MLSMPTARKFLDGRAALLFVAMLLVSGLASAPLRSAVGREEQQPQPPKGPLGPSQAGPRKGEEPRATLGRPRGATSNQTYQATGTIRSLSDTSLVLGVRANGKETRKAFVVNADTKKEGTVKVGARATVTYTAEGDKKVATRVALAVRPPASSKSKM